MKKTAVTLLGVIIAVIILHAFKASRTSAVTGRIKPGQRAAGVIARQGKDSVESAVAPDGTFRIYLTNGNWQLEVKRIDSDRQVTNIFLDSMTIIKAGDINLGLVSHRQ
jgi:hypothetical protein